MDRAVQMHQELSIIKNQLWRTSVDLPNLMNSLFGVLQQSASNGTKRIVRCGSTPRLTGALSLLREQFAKDLALALTPLYKSSDVRVLPAAQKCAELGVTFDESDYLLEALLNASLRKVSASIDQLGSIDLFCSEASRTKTLIELALRIVSGYGNYREGVGEALASAMAAQCRPTISVRMPHFHPAVCRQVEASLQTTVAMSGCSSCSMRKAVNVEEAIVIVMILRGMAGLQPDRIVLHNGIDCQCAPEAGNGIVVVHGVDNDEEFLHASYQAPGEGSCQ
jgi:hypothetical protein